MSDSDPEPARPLPPAAKIEQALRHVVRDVWLSGHPEDLTVKRVRKSVEQTLRLPDDFLKNDASWKDRSKHVITDQVTLQEQEDAGNGGGEDEPAKPQKPQKNPAASKSSSAPQKRKAPTKKQPTAASKPRGRKRQKVSVSSDEDDAVVRSDASETPESAPKKPAKKSRVVEEDSEGEDGAPAVPHPASSPHDSKAAESDSEMSVLIDEPPKKKRQKKATSTKEKPTKPANSKGKAKDDKGLDPQEAEIKRLQGWLVKCGIRKLWGKELKPFDTPKAKINHLKEMLKEAGMDGRYSVEKARQIKERRELAADLEAVQEGAKRWGQSDSEEDGGARPKRRLAKGLKDLEGLIESDGEETD
ncbi:putative transcriptional protein [Neofusicoccum parvum UCRNP2]|uniref:Uncharacterized protein n=2 Tax=Neofusicoccum parvum TaxID=310453 RepID=A0ACB5S4I8_9PEZI|nr:putative transcriptional protein [Neofusicoccum parvum UCRNP2]GME27301.1 hypothetical protein GTA08_BOTSDO10798 [Neofusicoccum parvum]